MGIGDVTRGGQPQPDLSLPDALSSQQAKTLVKLGQDLASDGLTTIEKEHLEEQLQLLIDSPNLPAPDKDALKNWKTKLEQAQTTTKQDSTVDLFDAKIHQNLLSTDPQVAMEAFNALGGVEHHVLTPAQKTLLKEGVSKIATKLAEIKSGNPEEIKAEIRELLKQAFKEILEKEGETPSDSELDALVGQFGAVIDEVAENMSLVNLTGQETLLYSTNNESIYQALLSASNLMFFPPDQIVIDKLENLAVQIAEANSRGTPIEEFGSKNPTVVADKLRQMMRLSPNDANYEALSGLAGGIGNSIAEANSSKQQILDGDDNRAMALLLVAHTAGTGGNVPAGDVTGLRRSEGVGAGDGAGGPPPLYFSATPRSNPYLTPGIMARLAPILSELAKIYTEMIKQSSELKQNMMSLTMEMAVEAFEYAKAAGKAKVAMLELEITEAIGNIATAAVSLAVTIGSFAYERASMSRFDKQKQPDFKERIEKQHAEHLNKVNNPNTDPAIARQDKKEYDNFQSKYVSKDSNGWDRLDNSKINREYNVSSERTAYHTKIDSQIRLVTAANTSISEITKNAIKIATAQEKIGLTMDQAIAEGMEKLISQLIQTIMDTMRSAGEEGQRADKDWQAFNQLFREIASTITSGMYR